MKITRLTPADFKTVPWKNGQGSTRELRFENIEGSETFAWRLSMAPVVTDGVFSDFSGYDRKLLLVEGEGMTLCHDNGQVDVLSKQFDIACFDGGWRTEAQLHRGEILDFNVMTRQGVCRAVVDSFAEDGTHQVAVQAGCLLVYAVGSEIAIDSPGTDSIQLAAGHLLEVREPIENLWGICGEGVICVQINWD